MKLFKHKKGATMDNFYVVAQLFGLALTFLILWVFWTNITGSDMDDAVWDQSTQGRAIKGHGQGVMDNLDFIFLMGYFGLHIGIIILAFLLRSHPVVLVAGIFLIVILVMISVPLSNSWEDITEDSTFVSSAAQLPKTNFLIQKLPIFEVIWGFLTLIILAAFARGEGYI